ncbi:MAG: hypothetical protein AABW86_05200 [Candidatus Micrarchaeota archaeon]
MELDSITAKQIGAIQEYIVRTNIKSEDGIVLTPKQRAELSAAIKNEYVRLKEVDANLKRFKELPIER